MVGMRAFVCSALASISIVSVVIFHQTQKSILIQKNGRFQQLDEKPDPFKDMKCTVDGLKVS